MRSEKCKEEKSPICAEIFDTKGQGHVTALVQSRAIKLKIKTFPPHTFPPSAIIRVLETRESNPLMSGLLRTWIQHVDINFKPHNPRGAYLWHWTSLG